MDLSNVIQRAVMSVQDPREGARWVISHDVSLRTAWEMLALVLICGAMLTIGAEAFGLAEPILYVGPELRSFTFGLSIINVAVLMVSAVLIHVVGRMFGGTGDLTGSVLLMAWLQFILVLIQITQFLFFLVMPAIAGLISFLAIFLLFWLPVNFIAVLHDFRSRGLVFVALLVGGAAMMLLIALIVGLSGIDLAMGSFSDV